MMIICTTNLDTYVNIQTDKYPDGEVRRQLKNSGSNSIAS